MTYFIELTAAVNELSCVQKKTQLNTIQSVANARTLKTRRLSADILCGRPLTAACANLNIVLTVELLN